MQNIEIHKNDIFCMSAVMKIFNFFDFLQSLLKSCKSPLVNHRTLECKYLLICMRNNQKSKMPKTDNFSQVLGLDNLLFFST